MAQEIKNPRQYFPIQGNIATIPIEWYPFFSQDPATASVEFLSFPTGSVNPFFRDIEKVYAAINNSLPNLLDWENYSLPAGFELENDKRPRFLHIDLAKTESGDGTGIAMCHQNGFKDVFKRNERGDFGNVKLPIVEFDFIGILRPRKSLGEVEMDYDALLRLIFQLSAAKFNLEEGIISFDSWQSHHIKTTLFKQGFNTDLLSIDQTTHKLVLDFDERTRIKRVSVPREPAGAMSALRDAIYQERCIFCSMPNYPGRDVPWIVKEALEIHADFSGRDRLLKAVKVPGGTDDMIQACAGACYNAVNNAELYVEYDNDVYAGKRRAAEKKEQEFYAQFGIYPEDRVPQSWIEDTEYINPRLRRKMGDGNSPEDTFYYDKARETMEIL